MTQLLCDGAVSFEYFNGFETPCSEAIIRDKLHLIMSNYPNKRIYIGITHHLCGRYTGNYELSPLPTQYKRYIYHYYPDAQLIEEVAHVSDYEKLFAICVARDKDSIRASEKDAIRVGKEISGTNNNKQNIIINDTEGGNGNLCPSDYYFLYVCISRSDIL